MKRVGDLTPPQANVADVGFPTPSVFVFDHGHRLGVGVTEQRWQTMARSKHAKGATTSDLFLLTKTHSEPDPELPEPEDFDW